jgi:hypothetical protein
MANGHRRGVVGGCYTLVQRTCSHAWMKPAMFETTKSVRATVAVIQNGPYLRPATSRALNVRAMAIRLRDQQWSDRGAHAQVSVGVFVKYRLPFVRKERTAKPIQHVVRFHIEERLVVAKLPEGTGARRSLR